MRFVPAGAVASISAIIALSMDAISHAAFSAFVRDAASSLVNSASSAELIKVPTTGMRLILAFTKGIKSTSTPLKR